MLSRLVVVLDLDETLVESIDVKDSLRIGSPQPQDPSSFVITVRHGDFNNWDRDDEVFTVHKRPGLDEFLLELASKYELALFTMASFVYADQIRKHLDPEGQIFSHFFHFEHCKRVDFEGGGPGFMKDLRPGFMKDLRQLKRPL